MNDLRNRILTIFNESQEITFDLDNGLLSLLQLVTQEVNITSFYYFELVLFLFLIRTK
jgi:hypothetical protein